MSGFSITPDGKLKIEFADRTVTSLDGSLVNILPSTENYVGTVGLSFPDVPKDYTYNWWWNSTYTSAGGGHYGLVCACTSWIAATPQEYETETQLAAVPNEINITNLMVRINRTGAPSHTWDGNPLDVLPKQNAWIPCTGSILLEAELGIARAFSLYVSGGHLVLHRQQSVGAVPGGYGYYGATATAQNGTANGGENVFGGAAGHPVLLRDAQNLGVFDYPGGFTDPRPAVPQWHRRGGSNPCAVSDITNYASTYSLEIAASFGRRSQEHLP